MQVLIVTGMSGAGKSTAMKMLEDMGFFCMDNLPIPLIDKFMELTDQAGNTFSRVAISVDTRSGTALGNFASILEKMREQNRHPQVLFLDAADEVLVKRYKETRRTHPLSGSDRVEIGICKERQMIQFLRDEADYIIDTSQLLTRELNAGLEEIFLKGSEYQNLYVTILSFGFKYGIPADSDLVFDVRFLPNPYYDANLRPKTGNDKEIQEFVFATRKADAFLDKLEDMLRFLIPNYVDEGKNQLVISVGCTGGKHRSVAMANGIYERLSKNATYGLKVEHRDLYKDSLRGK